MSSEKKKNLGQFFTKSSVWLRPQVKRFIDKVNPSIIVDPFAGEGDLLTVANKLGYKKTKGFDIDDNLSWNINDGLVSIPKYKDGLILTNPPYLAKNSAKRQKLDGYSYFDDNKFQDLYQIAIHNALISCEYAVFIIPETFITSSFFTKHLYSVTILEQNPFTDTDCPVCVCCFKRNTSVLDSNVYDIYKEDYFLFDSAELTNRLKRYDVIDEFNMKFNDATGNLGLRGIDGVTPEDRMCFCLPKDLGYDPANIKISSRAITLIKVDCKIDAEFLRTVNYYLDDYRTRTHDVFLSPFKNNNKSGRRRRRMDFKLARKFINKTIKSLG